MAQSKNILICGVGGQGTVLASKIISESALSNGEHVLSAETIGMAQRGGSVVSHVRIGEDVYSPLIGENEADCLIAFEASEAVRNISYLKKDAFVVVNKSVVQPVTASLTGKIFDVNEMIEALQKVTKNVVVVDTESACKELGSSKVINMVLLGALCKANVFNVEEICRSMKKLVKPQFYELNEKALFYTE